jgi:hypothetical protein
LSRRSKVRNLPTSAMPSAALRQLGIPFDSARLGGISLAERSAVLARLASLLLEAAGVVDGERDDDER